jgi:hypothetical protein
MSIKSSRPAVGLNSLKLSIALLALAGMSQIVRADQIPYAPIGAINPETYSFTATSTGAVDAYFAGSSAGYTEFLGLDVNGVATGITGLGNHSSSVGQVLDLGNAVAGDKLTLFIYVDDTAGFVYSDPTMNAGYDNNSSDGHQHVFATAYTGDGVGGSPVFPGIPTTNATFVGFEDLKYPNSDFDFNDTTYVVTNVTVPDGGMTIAMLGGALAGLASLRRRFSK